MILTHRFVSLIAFTLCLLALSSAYWFEYVEGLDPCSLCVLERWILIGITTVLLLGFIFWKAFFSLLALLGGLLGTAVASRHVWLEHHPYTEPISCTASFEQLLVQMPFSKALQLTLTHNASCSIVQYRLWGLSLAQWSVTLFVFLSIACFWMLLKRKRR